MDESDKTMREAAKVQAIGRNVPDKNCFHLNSRPAGAGNPAGKLLHQQAFSQVTLAQQLDIYSHATPDTVCDGRGNNRKSPAQLADLLERSGLKEVGVLKIKGCSVGKGNYLEQLRDELTERNIRVGYLSGPQGKLMELGSNFRLAGKRFTIASSRSHILRWQLSDSSRWSTLGSRRAVQGATGQRAAQGVTGRWLPARLMLKVVKGNVDVAFPGTRYTGPGQVARVDERAVERSAVRKLSTAGIATGLLVAGLFAIPFTFGGSLLAVGLGAWLAVSFVGGLGAGAGILLSGLSLSRLIQSFRNPRAQESSEGEIDRQAT